MQSHSHPVQDPNVPYGLNLGAPINATTNTQFAQNQYPTTSAVSGAYDTTNPASGVQRVGESQPHARSGSYPSLSRSLFLSSSITQEQSHRLPGALVDMLSHICSASPCCCVCCRSSLCHLSSTISSARSPIEGLSHGYLNEGPGGKYPFVFSRYIVISLHAYRPFAIACCLVSDLASLCLHHSSRPWWIRRLSVERGATLDRHDFGHAHYWYPLIGRSHRRLGLDPPARSPA